MASIIATLQRGTTTVLDTFLQRDVPDTPHGATDPIQIGKVTGSSTEFCRALFRFDLSTIPAGATINSAVLTLHNTGGGTIQVINPFLVKRVTDVGAVHGSTLWTEAGATWNKYDGITAWSVAGGDVTAVGQLSVTLATPTSDLVLDITPLILDAISARGNLLQIMVRRTSEISPGSADLGLFTASENGTAGNRPTLLVTYTIPISIYYGLQQSVQTTIINMIAAGSLPDILAGSVLLRKLPWAMDVGTLDGNNPRIAYAPPGIIIFPAMREALKFTVNQADDIMYPVGLLFMDVDSDPATNHDRNLYWREKMRRQFVRQRYVVTTPAATMYDCEIEPGLIMDYNKWVNNEIFAGAMVLKFWSRESRGN